MSRRQASEGWVDSALKMRARKSANEQVEGEQEGATEGGETGG
jgi:hypothetical protein